MLSIAVKKKVLFKNRIENPFVKLHEIQKVCAPSRPAELLVTCHCGCRLLSIVVEKKRVWAKKEVANKMETWNDIFKARGGCQ